MKNLRLLPILLVTFPMFGFTNCSNFSNVTVPAVDTYAPVVGSRVYAPGGPSGGSIHFGPVSYQTEDEGAQWILAPYAYDAGGVRLLSVTSWADKRCCQDANPNICAWITSLTQAYIDEEDAAPGDSVSNGRYDYFIFRPGGGGPGGTTCNIDRMGYLVQAADFAGNTSATTGSVTYTTPQAPDPPGGCCSGGWPPIVGGSTGGDNCDESKEGAPCMVQPEGCQSGFLVEGTWQCINRNDKCVPPPEGIAGSYCGGPWNGSTRLGCGRGMYQSGWEYGSACTQGGSPTSRCMPGTKCVSGLHPQHGSACGPVPACGTLPPCWLVDEAANVCASDDI